jgi:hypothetical protein
LKITQVCNVDEECFNIHAEKGFTVNAALGIVIFTVIVVVDGGGGGGGGGGVKGDFIGDSKIILC